MDVGVCWLVGWLVSVTRRIGLLVCLWSWVLVVGGGGWCGWVVTLDGVTAGVPGEDEVACHE